MVFSGLSFLFFFLPCVLTVYYLVPKGWKNGVLLVFSLLFYGWGEPRCLIWMVLSVVQAYCFALAIAPRRGQRSGRWLFLLSVGFSLGLLGYFKYAGFFLDSFRAVTGLPVPALRIALPIGISFYTFQILSYVTDVYRGTAQPQRNPVTLGAYITMFPQLIAGPIVRYTELETQLACRTLSREGLALGIRRFVIGLAKKVLLANQLALLAARTPADVPSAWLIAASYCLQIYYDFSGYSDMAIGLGHLLGFTLPENFRYPLTAPRITEFWRRWHMTLGSWFRDYVYIPLGGNRVSRRKWVRNILAVWALTGLWHGAAWNFVLWGLLFGVLLLVEKLWLRPVLDAHPRLSHLYVLFFVLVSFTLFHGDTLSQALPRLKALFGMGVPFRFGPEGLYYGRSFALLLVSAVLGATPLPAAVWSRVTEKRRGDLLSIAGLVVLWVLCVASLVDGSFNPFLYFRF